ncbi:MAG: anthranilate synthase component I [Gammaproteobacteria bacterium]|nr:anthranilate synthase component I [Gammaproteobacteria bacterium]NNL99542.1 anthranilate synthase component I [Gammaproteobacteria bacterium]
MADDVERRVAVAREILADLDTPLSAYLKIADAPYTYLFESVQGGERWGRYSVIGLPARKVIRISGPDISIEEDGEIVERITVDDPFAWIADYRARYRVEISDDLPRSCGGLVGYFSYDSVRYVEPRLKNTAPADALGCPDIMLLVSEEVLVFDNLRGRIQMIQLIDPDDPAAPERAESRAGEIIAALARPLDERWRTLPARREAPGRAVDAELGQADFQAAVRRIKRYIVDGDVMQVVLAQRLSTDYAGEPVTIYRALRSLNPSPYMYFLNLDDFHIIGSSPEILVRLEDQQVTVRPIAGTRPRGRTDADDRQHEADLLSDDKELAEHLMLIDLGRNDISRVAQAGSVELTEQMIVERYSHVMHIVSNVTARLAPGLSAEDVLRATFPAGTVSGAPKVRAMEIIDELEPVKRGVYAGAVGYISWQGNMDTAIAIRTALVRDGRIYVQAGAGIVADSDPEREWQETLNKGQALFKALELAEQGLVGA